ncbi:MAG: S46 family peptidase [Rhodothermia bacterium]|nr:S46 family peptidase [Rhodothermia bacterium]
MKERGSSACRQAALAVMVVLLPIFVAEASTSRGEDMRPTPVPGDTVKAGPFDNGRMWAFEYPPVDYFRSEYGIEASDEWLEHARLGALRLPNCTASFVSPNGLVMTNHHCVRSAVAALSKGEEALLDTGFYSSSTDEERPAPSLYVDQLIEIEDVTDEVFQAEQGWETVAERANARSEAIQAIQDRKLNEVGGADAGYIVQVVSLYTGGRHSAYTFKRYQDVRLVMAPEITVGHFGGDADNFTYPRYALDMSFLRVYDDGRPLSVEHYFPWSEEGASEGDPVFVVGNPGSTLRLESVAQLEFRRDFQDRQLLEFYRNRHKALRSAYEETGDANVRATMLSASNGEKAYEGRIQGLDDPALIARRLDAERQFISAIDNDPVLNEKYGSLIADLAAIQLEKAEFGKQYSIYLAMTPSSPFTSETLKRALAAYEYVKASERGLPGEILQQLADAVRAVEDSPDPLDRNLLEGRISLMMRFAENADDLDSYFDGRTAESVVDAIFESSVLVDSDQATAALENGTLGIEDPAIQFIASFAGHRSNFVSGWSGLTARESELASKRGRAQFDVYGLSIPPDATFSLRIADGVVKGYEYNGTVAPPYTTFYGMFDHYYSYAGSELAEEWALPEQWLEARNSIDLKTPVDIVSTNDIIGGNSGSPLLNSDLEVVGLVFDGNIESLPGAYVFRTEKARTVSVDSRGMLEALDTVYKMDHIVHELKTGELVEGETSASH